MPAVLTVCLSCLPVCLTSAAAWLQHEAWSRSIPHGQGVSHSGAIPCRRSSGRSATALKGCASSTIHQRICPFVQAERWGDLPLYALGASSGGAMVALLPFFVQLQVCNSLNLAKG